MKNIDEWFHDLNYNYGRVRHCRIDPTTKEVTYHHYATQPFICTIDGVDLYQDDIITFDIRFYKDDLDNWVTDNRSSLPDDKFSGELETETGFCGVAKIGDHNLWIDFRDYHYSTPLPEVKNKGLFVWRNGDPYINYQYKWIRLITNVKVIGNTVLNKL